MIDLQLSGIITSGGGERYTRTPVINHRRTRVSPATVLQAYVPHRVLPRAPALEGHRSTQRGILEKLMLPSCNLFLLWLCKLNAQNGRSRKHTSLWASSVPCPCGAFPVRLAACPMHFRHAWRRHSTSPQDYWLPLD